MTALEKLKKELPNMIYDHAPVACPSTFDYLDDPDYCGDECCCIKCWNREIPGTKNKEKENKNMDIPERTDEKNKKTTDPTCDLNYKAEYERLSEENKKLKCCNELYVKEIGKLREVSEQYRFIIKTIEAMTGRDILEDF